MFTLCKKEEMKHNLTHSEQQASFLCFIDKWFRWHTYIFFYFFLQSLSSLMFPLDYGFDGVYFLSI